jgi:RNA-directed DNA polymerase
MKEVPRAYQISRGEMLEAWKAVKRAAGGAGLDGENIEMIEEKLEDKLYKVWNRMSSGSYQAQTVKLVTIPKANGGVRTLGIPTVTDRIAQSVIKNRLNKDVDQHFHEDSYAYREGKSAVDAVQKARERCMKQEWVVEIDIKGFFDNLDHDLMLEILEQYTEDKLVLLYCKKFLKAEGCNDEGEKFTREKGTPQGGVVSPVLANLYLHEALDKWMKDRHPSILYERYADDIIVHAVSEKQAHYLRNRIEGRLKIYKLELNLEKTRVVYAGRKNDYDDRGHKLSRKFTFLGYDFKPRRHKGRIIFTPGMGQGALLMINKKIKALRLDSLTHTSIDVIAKMINTKSRGWIGYYGHCRRSELYKLSDLLNKRIVKWLKKKHKVRRHGKAWDELKAIKTKKPRLFVHWYMIACNPLRAV